MDLLRYEFIEGPDDSINGMLRKLVTELRYNRSLVSIEEFRDALPSLKKIEQKIQYLDSQIGDPHRSYISEIMRELELESENETNIEEDLRIAITAIIDSIIGEKINFDELSYVTGKAQHYHWIQFLGYVDQRPIDGSALIAREVFRAICNKYNYIFIDLS